VTHLPLPREIERTQPAADVVRSALERLCASVPFKKSPQLAAFLRYVVEAVLNGHAETIKAYTVAVDALGRPDNFDPVGDAIVRVEARRLRRALADYYDGDGARDTVVIGMRPGNYVPSIGWRGAADDAVELAAKQSNGEKARAAPVDFYLAYSESVISDGQSAMLRRQLLFARCHRGMAAMWHTTARLKIEIDDSRSLVLRARNLVEHSRNRRRAHTD
jgi:hypothetical protein